MPVGSAYSTGAIRKTANGLDPLYQPIANMASPLVAGAKMRVTIQMTNRTVGGVIISQGANVSATFSTNAVHTFEFTVTDPTAPILFSPSITTARYYLDNATSKTYTGGTLDVNGATILRNSFTLLADVTLSTYD